ncbi:MAG TPA: hypothetical protein PK398_02925 [Candidatus Gracilibacteria bacterium]|nr:hypothetical protein [Candidatus Gracilibacteria bacterium]
MFFTKNKQISAIQASSIVRKAKKLEEKKAERSLNKNAEWLQKTFEFIEQKANEGKSNCGIYFHEGFPQNWQEIETYFRNLGYIARFDNNAVWEPAVLRLFWGYAFHH